MTWLRMPGDAMPEHPSEIERSDSARKSMPRWATVLVFLLTVLAWAVTLRRVASTSGVFQAFLTLFVLPIEEGLQLSRAVSNANWMLAGILGAHFVTAAVYLFVWHRRYKSDLRYQKDGGSGS